MSQSKEYKPTHGGYPGAVPAAPDWVNEQSASITGLVSDSEATKFPLRTKLRAALALIDAPTKWGRGEFLSRNTGCMCMLGAIGKINGVGPAALAVIDYADFDPYPEVGELGKALRADPVAEYVLPDSPLVLSAVVIYRMNDTCYGAVAATEDNAYAHADLHSDFMKRFTAAIDRVQA